MSPVMGNCVVSYERWIASLQSQCGRLHRTKEDKANPAAIEIAIALPYSFSSSLHMRTGQLEGTVASFSQVNNGKVHATSLTFMMKSGRMEP